MSDLRKPFWEEMVKICKEDRNALLLTGDLGYPFYKEFKRQCPWAFINAGCAEQSMVGIAAGMARGGKKPYVYSGSIFLLMRAYEQIRDDIAYNGVDVKLIGTGAAGFLGFTHNYIEPENEWDLIKNIPLRFVRTDNPEYLIEELRRPGAAFIRL